MELVITKNGKLFARATDDSHKETDVYGLLQFTEVPEYPTEKAPKGKYWELDLVDGQLVWVLKDRPLTVEEKIEELQSLTQYNVMIENLEDPSENEV